MTDRTPEELADLLDRYPPVELELALRPPGWDPFELLRCPRCEGRGRADVYARGRQIIRRCPLCKGAKRLLLGEPAESAYCLILDYRRPVP
jgi:hypothetical protein